MRNVIIVQRVLPHYRIELFKQLHQALLENDIYLTVVYGQHQPGTVPETVRIENRWAIYIPNYYFKLFGTDLVFQKLPKISGKPGLIIIEQANRLISNYILLAQRYTKGLKVAYWGHGMNFQSEGKSWFKEKFKKLMLTKVDWWFAYTRVSANIVSASGYSVRNITVLNNAIDNDFFSESLKQVTSQLLVKTQQLLALQGKDTGLYCGGLYKEKQINFLIKTSIYIHKLNPDFELIIIGDGPDRSIVEDAILEHQWIHYVGSQFGENRAKYFKLAKLLLMPGLVGLAILDSFIAKTPIITTNIPIHSPEIAYLVNGENGMMCEYDELIYADTVNQCFKNESLYNHLIDGCKKSADEYTMQNMVSNFKQGIVDCLTTGHG